MGIQRGAILGMALAGLVVGAWLGASSQVGLGPATAEVTATTTPAHGSIIRVHVAGWVVSPGVVELPDGAIVADAVGAAGGARAGAMLDRINLSRPVVDSELIEVPGPDAAGPIGTAGEDRPISINRADTTQLERLPGVGEVLAGRIVAYREANGPFATVEDLLDVPGIGEAKLASIRDLITVP